MKRLTEFYKTAILGGLFLLLPLLLIYLLLGEMLQVVVALATPIADLLTKGTFEIQTCNLNPPLGRCLLEVS